MEERQRYRNGAPPERSGLPRWPAALALLGVGALYAVLSGGLTLGPRAFLLGLVAVLLVPLLSAHLTGSHRLARGLVSGDRPRYARCHSQRVPTGFVVVGAGRRYRVAAGCALLWVITCNVRVWYWEIDGGGPARRRRGGHVSEDFVFPQMNVDDKTSRDWSPGFLDYLFLAFNTSTAFSPTDTAFLSRRAKVLMMAQALLSLLILAVLVSRAINTLAAA